MDGAIQLVQAYEANYPELLHRVFVINGMNFLLEDQFI